MRAADFDNLVIKKRRKVILTGYDIPAVNTFLKRAAKAYRDVEAGNRPELTRPEVMQTRFMGVRGITYDRPTVDKLMETVAAELP